MNIVEMALPDHPASPTARQEYLERQPTYWLKRCYQSLRRRVDGDLRPFGVTLSQREALLSLHHFGPTTLGSLADQLGLEQSSVSRLMVGLAKRRLVSIDEHTSDRRVRVVSLTDAGEELVSRTPGASRLAGTLLARELSEAEMSTLIDLLRRATGALESIQPVMSPSESNGKALDEQKYEGEPS